MMNATVMTVPCECGQSTVKRYAGRYCGPKRQGCSRKVKGTDDPVHTLPTNEGKLTHSAVQT